MKKKFAIALITAISALGGFSVAEAGAANCTGVGSGAVFWSGQLTFQAQVTNCSGVNGVDWGPADGSPGVAARLFDLALGSPHYANNCSSGTLCQIGGAQVNYYTFFYVSSYCSPHVNHSVTKNFRYRIRNSVGSTWGPWHPYTSPSEVITC